MNKKSTRTLSDVKLTPAQEIDLVCRMTDPPVEETLESNEESLRRMCVRLNREKELLHEKCEELQEKAEWENARWRDVAERYASLREENFTLKRKLNMIL